MKDIEIKGTGNSRFMKSNISPSTTLAQLVEMLNNGTFPFDLNGINPAGINALGDALNKANLFPDGVATALGLNPADNPQVANGLLKLSNAALRSTSGGNKLTDMKGNEFPLPYARIETGSYVGIGMYGTANPNSFSCSFAAKYIIIIGVFSNSVYLRQDYYLAPFSLDSLTTTYKMIERDGDFTSIYMRKSSDGKTIYWYSTNGAAKQLNNNGTNYYVLVGGI